MTGRTGSVPVQPAYHGTTTTAGSLSGPFGAIWSHLGIWRPVVWAGGAIQGPGGVFSGVWVRGGCRGRRGCVVQRWCGPVVVVCAVRHHTPRRGGAERERREATRRAWELKEIEDKE